LNTADLPAFATGETPSFASKTVEVVLKNVQLSDALGNGIAQAVTIELADSNYCAEPLQVVVKINPIQLVKITWVDYEKLSQYTFAYGDLAAHMISALGVTADGSSYPLSIQFPENYGNVGVYDTVTAIAPDGFAFASGVSATTRVTITPPTYTVWMDDAIFVGNANNQVKPTVYSLIVGGNLPADILAAITYTNNGQSAFGTYEVVATLPANANCAFVNKAGEAVTSLTATLEIRRTYVVSNNQEIPYQVVLTAPNGIPAGVSASVTIPEAPMSEALDEFPVYKAYTVSIVGTADSALTLTIPFASELYTENCAPLTADDLYVYNNVNGELFHANMIEGLTVTIGDGFYQVTGVPTDCEMTFVLAPVYNAPFWGSVWSILLIIFIALLLLGGMMALGFFRLRRVGSK